MTCDGDTLTSFTNPVDPQYLNDDNTTTDPNEVPSADQNRSPYGYTKVPHLVIGMPDMLTYTYDLADTYQPPYNGIQWSNDDQCVEVLDSRSSRIAASERTAQFESILPHTDAPFPFFQVQLQVCCSGCGTVQVRVSRTAFPTTTLYVNDLNVSEIYQADLGTFIASAGYVDSVNDLSPPGNGVFAPEGEALTWNGCAIT